MNNSDFNSDRPETGPDTPQNTDTQPETPQSEQLQPEQLESAEMQSESAQSVPHQNETQQSVPPQSSQYVYAGAPVAADISKEPHHKRTRMFIGLTAVFLLITILFSTITAVVVYNITNRRNENTTSQTTNSLPTTKPTLNTPGEQTQPSTAPPSESSTDKNFSIAGAASKQSPGKTALSIIQIAKAAKPAVVAISTESRIQNSFGQTGVVEAAGSGFILTIDGYIVTNYHVIEGAQTISVALDDGRKFTAAIVGFDSNNDIAVLKISGQNLPTVSLGVSADLEVGELAVAIGNPLGELSGTVTAGIISALDRKITIDGQSLNLLQTDAAINAGNSGGALINSFGEVIGINTAKNAGSGIEGLGFAIPIDTAKPIIESLIRFGYVQGRPKIGIGTRDVTAQMAQTNNLPIGVYVNTVEANSAASIAGIKIGDVIIKADGKETLTTEALNLAKGLHKIGDTMSITLVRDGQEMTVSLILKEDAPQDVRPASYSSKAGKII